jgi:hypothetical protein
LNKQLIVCAALAASVCTSASAQAQYARVYPPAYARGVLPQQAAAIVRATGMTPIAAPVRRGPNYLVIAADRSGARMRVLVDAYDGRIVRVRQMWAARPVGRPYAPVAAPPMHARAEFARPEMQEPPAAGYEPYEPRPPVPADPQSRELPAPPPGAAPYGRSARADEGIYPVPPRAIPNVRPPGPPPMIGPPTVAPPPPGIATPRAAVAPPAAVAQPRRTPLPRPRPAVASNEAEETTGSVLAPAAPAAASNRKVAPAAPKAAPAPKSSELKLVPVAPLE